MADPQAVVLAGAEAEASSRSGFAALKARPNLITKKNAPESDPRGVLELSWLAGYCCGGFAAGGWAGFWVGAGLVAGAGVPPFTG
jgi:hypothetical protein